MATSTKRLFVGNLAESLDEYTLIKFLSKHGKIAKFDYLFHKTGPKAGKPRGYAFVEYATGEEALKTMIELDGKLLLGRKLAIKRANEAPAEYAQPRSGPGAWRTNAQKHTTLSMLKGHGKSETPDNKIKALEAKLQALEAEKAASDASRNASASISEGEGTPGPSAGEDQPGEDNTQADAGPVASTSTLPPSASLPPKPLTGLSSEPAADQGQSSSGFSVQRPGPLPSTSALRHQSSLPSKPLPSLPRKPDSSTLAQGEKERRTHKAESEQRQGQRPDQRYHDRRHDRNKKPQEVPKSTLASLGAGMGR